MNKIKHGIRFTLSSMQGSKKGPNLSQNIDDVKVFLLYVKG
jgi:hypothetical protein